MMNYIQPGYFPDLPVTPNEIIVYNTNFSLLIKFHIPTSNKIKFSLASGWTHSVRQDDYFIYDNSGSSQTWYSNVTSYTDFRIPFLAEIGYALSNKLDIQGKTEI